MKQIFNELPRPTFRWMRVNHQELETPEVKLVPEAAVEERHEGSAEVTFFTGRRVPNLEDFAGASQESMKDALEKGNVNCEISVKDGEKAKVWLDYSLSETVSPLWDSFISRRAKIAMSRSLRLSKEMPRTDSSMSSFM